MPTHTLNRTVAAFAALALVGCASSKPKPDKSEKAAQKKAEEAKRGDADESTGDRGIPPLEDLEFRAKAPTAQKTAEKYGVTAYRVGKLHILHKPTPANQVVSAKVYLDGGVANLDEKTAGIERLALRLSAKGGTESTPKDEFTSELDSMGSSVTTFAERDYSGYALRCTTNHFEKSWDLFIEAMLEPKMPKGELGVQRKKQIAQIEKIQQNPNQYVSYLARKMIAGEHPYRHMQLGTKENVESFTRKQLLAYQRSLMNPARMLVVVVGDLPTKKVVQNVRGSLGRLVGDDWSSPSLPSYNVEGTALDGRKKPIPTNYIYGVFPAPEPTHEDYAAMKVAMAYLSDELFEEVRTKRNLSYAVSSGIASHRTNSGYLYVSAKKPNKTLQVMFDEVKKLQSETLGDKQLERTRNVYLTEHFQDLETNSSQATNLARAQLIRGDWRKHQAFLEDVKAVTPKDVQRVAKEYLKDYQFAVIGSPDSVDKSVIP